MSGLYPDDKQMTCFGETIKFPGMGSDGKFTNGDFSNPLTAPSRLDAGTINLVLDLLSGMISKLGGTANNTSTAQLANLFTSAATALRGVQRDKDGRAKVAAPSAADDIARKAEVDAEATARAAAVSSEASARVSADSSLSNAISSETAARVKTISAEATARSSADSGLSNAISNHTGNKANPHGVTKAQLGLENVPNVTTNNQTPSFSAAGTLETLVSGEKLSVSMGKIMKSISDFISHNNSRSNPHGVTKTQLGLGNCDNTADSTKNVDKVDGYHAGTSAGMLIPVTAFSFGATSGYIKWGNGLIIQFGTFSSNYNGWNTLTLPIALTKIITALASAFNNGEKNYSIVTFTPGSSATTLDVGVDGGRVSWIAIGL